MLLVRVHQQINAQHIRWDDRNFRRDQLDLFAEAHLRGFIVRAMRYRPGVKLQHEVIPEYEALTKHHFGWQLCGHGAVFYTVGFASQQ